MPFLTPHCCRVPHCYDLTLPLPSLTYIYRLLCLTFTCLLGLVVPVALNPPPRLLLRRAAVYLVVGRLTATWNLITVVPVGVR